MNSGYVRNNKTLSNFIFSIIVYYDAIFRDTAINEQIPVIPVIAHYCILLDTLTSFLQAVLDHRLPNTVHDDSGVAGGVKGDTGPPVSMTIKRGK